MRDLSYYLQIYEKIEKSVCVYEYECKSRDTQCLTSLTLFYCLQFCLHLCKKKKIDFHRKNNNMCCYDVIDPKNKYYT